VAKAFAANAMLRCCAHPLAARIIEQLFCAGQALAAWRVSENCRPKMRDDRTSNFSLVLALATEVANDHVVIEDVDCPVVVNIASDAHNPQHLTYRNFVTTAL
jgi:hypothetical protein